MARDCKIFVQIDDGDIVDVESVIGLYLIDSDDTVVAPVKDYEVQEYPESAAAEIYPHTTKKPFDYTCKMLAFGELPDVNTTVSNFYDSLLGITEGVDLRQAKKVTIYNEYKGVKVSGYAKTLSGTDYYPNLTKYENGAFIFDFVLYIADPRTLTPWNKPS
jgi:hypothetical protein